MTQFEYDQLKILAGAWKIESTNAIAPIAKVCSRHAEELLDLIRQMKTEPAESVEGEPPQLPPMRWPSDRPTLAGIEDSK